MVGSRLRPRTGAWFWRRKANRPQHKRRWKNSAEFTGDRFIAFSGERGSAPMTRRILPKVSSRHYWSTEIWTLFARKGGAFVHTCSGGAEGGGGGKGGE